MTTEERIRQVAEQLVAQTQANVGRLRSDLEEARQRVTRLEAELRGTQLAPQRLSTFQVKRDGDYQCPECGIKRGEQSAMTPRPGNPRLDLFECATCRFEIDVQH
jgi:ribosome-interacting GTPase 1